MPNLLETTANTLRTRWKTQVADVIPLPTAYDNMPFTAPNDAPWARFEIQLGTRAQASAGAVGSRRYRVRGRAVATLYHPLRTGDAAALALCDVATEAFRGTSDTGVHLLTPTAPDQQREASQHSTRIEFPFYADEIA
jgi:hypothetical protein